MGVFTTANAQNVYHWYSSVGSVVISSFGLQGKHSEEGKLYMIPNLQALAAKTAPCVSLDMS